MGERMEQDEFCACTIIRQSSAPELTSPFYEPMALRGHSMIRRKEGMTHLSA
jgi:hypothetical protein